MPPRSHSTVLDLPRHSFHVIVHLFLNHLTNIHCLTINVSGGSSSLDIEGSEEFCMVSSNRSAGPADNFGPVRPDWGTTGYPGFAGRNRAETKVVVDSVRSGSEGIIMPSFTTVIAALMFPALAVALI